MAFHDDARAKRSLVVVQRAQTGAFERIEKPLDESVSLIEKGTLELVPLERSYPVPEFGLSARTSSPFPSRSRAYVPRSQR
ncbi:MAG TPA: hypothetical protein VN603_04975, partial [Candidatus Acidoferrales bacterium]|nr:hypothetical protein [Candidatus Acidoferrales bacterium]